MARKKKEKKSSWIWWALGCIVLVVLLALYMMYSSSDEPVVSDYNTTSEKESYETVPIKSTSFLTDDVTSLDVSIGGVALGDSMDMVRTTLGEYDNIVNQEQTPLGQENWRYSAASLNLEGDNNTAIIVHFDNGFVSSINVQKVAASLLSDDFDFDHKPSNYFAFWGSPQIDKDLSWIGLRKLGYTEKGVELYFSNGIKLNTITFSYPI